MKYFFREKSISERIKKYKKILLVLDFDGTLSPIVDRPYYAKISPQFKSALVKFGHSEKVFVAIISGRSIAWLKSLINLDFIYYSGNHGIEIKGRGISFLCKEAKKNRKLLFKAYKHLKHVFSGMPGIIIENKGFSMALHYRGLKPEYKNEFKSKILSIKKEFSCLPVLWEKGHEVLELMPKTSYNKGKAALYLYRHLGYPYPIAIGDDRTDEDMFRVFKRTGLTIRVKPRKNSHAQFYLKNQKEVLKVLKLIYNSKFKT